MVWYEMMTCWLGGLAIPASLEEEALELSQPRWFLSILALVLSLNLTERLPGPALLLTSSARLGQMENVSEHLGIAFGCRL
jgi:hypothetical protein